MYRNDQIIIQYKSGIDTKLKIVKVPKGQVEEKLKAYQSDSNVISAVPDYITEACFVPNDTYYIQGYQSNLNSMQVSQAWDITKGSASVKVAILDSGIDTTHQDLQGKVITSANFTDSITSEDIYGHGTGIAGIVSALTNNNLGIAGIGFNTSLLNVKIINDQGWCYLSSILPAIFWSTDNGANIISMQFAGIPDNQPLKDAIDYAWAKGCLLVCAAGNENTDTPKYPMAYPNVIAVAAFDSNHNKVPASNYGSWVDIAAFNTVWSTKVGNRYGYYSGTSFASPQIAGIAALALATGRTNQEVFSQIVENTEPLGDMWTVYNIGSPNAYKTVTGELMMVTFTGSLKETNTGKVIAGKQVTISVSRAGIAIGDITTTSLLDGTFSIANSYPAGSYSAVAKTAEDANYEAGISAVVNFTVSKTAITVVLNVS